MKFSTYRYSCKRNNFLQAHILLIGMLSLCLFPPGISLAQAGVWNWARGAGGSGSDAIGGSCTSDALHADSAGNVYELVNSNSASISFGSFTFTYSGGSSTVASYLVKYSPQGAVLWARQFPKKAVSGYFAPLSMFTDDRGFSTLIIPVSQDSVNIGGVIAKDSSISFTRKGYCIARYDPNGSVASLSLHRSPNSDWYRILAWSGGRILALGGAYFAPDTLHGIIGDRGSFLAIMDSVGDVLRIKNLGYDSSHQFIYGPVVEPAGILVGVHCSYLVMPNNASTVLNQSELPVGSVPYPKTLVIRLDSALGFTWGKVASNNVGATSAVDGSNSLYLSGNALSKIPEDTLAFDTARMVVPFRSPLGQYEYLSVIKVSQAGALTWMDTFQNQVQYSGVISAISTDKLNNAYVYGRMGPVLTLGSVTLTGGNIFIAKIARSGAVSWGLSAQGRFANGGILADASGNIYANGNFSLSNAFFGRDTLQLHTPAAGAPNNPDIYLARIGTCRPSQIAIVANGATEWCGSDSVSLSAPGFTAYLWNTGDTSREIVAKLSGTYQVTSMDSSGCLASSAGQVVKSNPDPIFSSLMKADASCYGISDGSLSAITSAGTAPYALSYSPPLADSTRIPAGLYTVTATDGKGCTVSDTFRISQPAALTVSVVAIDDTNAAGVGSAVATAAGGTAPYAYVWSTSPPQSADTADSLRAGSYVVTATDSHGCKAIDSAIVRVVAGLLEAGAEKLSVYPVPAGSSFHVIVDGKGWLRAFSLDGKEVLHQAMASGDNEIPCGQLSNGEYLITLELDNGKGGAASVMVRR